jgi:hypothetical protein
LLVFAFLLTEPGKAQAQTPEWVTNGNNINNTNTGNVGIGITNPAAKLDVLAGAGAAAGIFRGDISSGNQFSGQLYIYTSGPANTRVRIGFADSATGAVTAQLESARYPFGGGYLSFITRLPGDFGMVERMRIDNSGNVGIGITNPAYRLDVQGGQINTSGGLCIAGDCKTSWSQLGSSSQWTTSGANIFYNSGNVGVGTTAPSSKLHVVGDVTLTGTGNISASGTITAGNIVAKYQDIAEWVPARHAMPAGTVVVLDTERSNQVVASQSPYDTRVAGVVSDSPGVILGESGEGKVKVATTGRVKVKVDATRAPIRVGDLLVTSDKQGIAMRSEPLNLGGTLIHRPGTLIGKALEPIDKGVGEILVLLSLQ